MSRDQIVVGLDIGTSAIRTVVARLINDKPQIIGMGEVPAEGIKRGVVVDIEDAVQSIRASIDRAEKTVGFAIKEVYVGVGGCHFSTKLSKGIIAVSRANGEISGDDVLRVIDAASAISLPPNREVLHVVNRFFVVDNQPGIQDPVGMHGVRLEVDSLLIEGGTPFLKNIAKCVEEAGLRISGLVFAPLAAAQAVLSKNQKSLGVVTLDIGSGTTDLMVFEEGYLFHLAVLPFGASHITNDIAIGLRTGVDIAESVKLEYGTALAAEINKKETINLTGFGLEDGERVYRRQVVEIIEARITEIFELANKELKRINRQGLLPAGVVIYGGGSKLQGIVDMAKKELKLPAQLGFPRELGGMIDKVDDPSFATAVGLTLWGVGENKLTRQGSSIGNTKQKVKNWFKSLLP